MNRRDAIVTITGTAIACPVLYAQQPQVAPAFDMPDDQRKKEYAICKVRGHQPDHPAPGALTYPPPPVQYVCKFCRTTYWTEIKEILHETGAPE